MSVYFIANIKVNDLAKYQQYLDRCDEVFTKYNGKYLVVDQNPTVLEGEWKYDRIVMIRFPQEADLRRWYDSPEYQEILQYRLDGAECNTLIAHGLVGQSQNMDLPMECRVTCGACCIAPSISSPIPGMPRGKPAGVRCVQLTEENRCKLFGKPERPPVCLNLQASPEMCGNTSIEALAYLAELEIATKPEVK